MIPDTITKGSNVNEETSTGLDSAGTRDLSRRTVLRTAAHAAWAVPVISAISAAPAFAATSDVFTVVTALTVAPNRLSGVLTVSVTNPAGGTLPANGVAVVVSAITRTTNRPSVTRNVRAVSGSVQDPSSSWTPTSFTGGIPYTVTNASIPDGTTSSFALTITFAAAIPLGRTVTISGTVSTASAFTPPSKGFSAATVA